MAKSTNSNQIPLLTDLNVDISIVFGTSESHYTQLLKKNGINTLEDARLTGKKGLATIKGIGKKTITKIAAALEKYGSSLGNHKWGK